MPPFPHRRSFCDVKIQLTGKRTTGAAFARDTVLLSQLLAAEHAQCGDCNDCRPLERERSRNTYLCPSHTGAHQVETIEAAGQRAWRSAAHPIPGDVADDAMRPAPQECANAACFARPWPFTTIEETSGELPGGVTVGLCEVAMQWGARGGHILHPGLQHGPRRAGQRRWRGILHACATLLRFSYTRKGSDRGNPQSTIMYSIQNIDTH